MYDELVKRLRELAAIPEHCENVANCDQCSKEDICLSFTNKRIIEVATQAADAIEELRRSEAVALENLADEHNRRLALEQKLRWIPVIERLPEKGYYVLAYEDGDIMMASYSYSDGKWYLRDMYEIIELKPTHWMPLPQPPKEET